MKIRVALILGMLSCAVMLSSCSTLASWKEAIFGDGKPYVIHLHKYTSQPTEENEMHAVEVAPGRFVYLERKPVVTSLDIKKLDVIDAPHGKKFRVTLDGHGRAVWTQVTARNRGKKLIVMLDHDYYGWVQIDRLNQDGIFTIPGPFSDEVAEKILEKAPEHRK